MGHVISKTQKKVRVLMLGLDSAGKTTVLYKLKVGETINTKPTLGYNVETVGYRHLNFTLWDIGGQDLIRPLWRHYFKNARSIIFVVDSSDLDRIHTARDELQKLLNDDELNQCSILVYANKQDLPDVITDVEMKTLLGLNAVKNRHWHIQACCATSGEGIYEGLDQLSLMMRARNLYMK